MSLLREFVEASLASDDKKGIATLALNQLQKITAGTGEQDPVNENPPENTVLGCIPRPRAG